MANYKAIIKDVRQEDRRIYLVIGFHVDNVLIEEQRTQIDQDLITDTYIDAILSAELQAFIDRYTNVQLLSSQQYINRTIEINQ